MKLIFKIVPDDFKTQNDDVVVQIRFGDNYDDWIRLFFMTISRQLAKNEIGLDENHIFVDYSHKSNVMDALKRRGLI